VDHRVLLKYVNYTILVVPAAMIFLWIYWHASVKNWFTGPKQTIEHDRRGARGRRLPIRVATLTGPACRRGDEPLLTSVRFCERVEVLRGRP
jgi:hypothetical protein